ncbi:MAG: prephenate dehydrogenase/arogenate dehydrogenase family protein [Ilumatobacteraceae bacterium]
MTTRRANVMGLGLIGGSLGLALIQRGWQVSGIDSRLQAESEALALGIISSVGIDPDADITFVATPVSSIAQQVRLALADTRGLVTDVGGVKSAIVNEIDNSRFVGGHPMAGSELVGLQGADGSLFEGAVWVLTPRDSTADSSFASVAKIVGELGAEIVVLTPARHDQLIAVVSHLPHLTAATLMGLANSSAEEHVAVLRLAAGGFRDMTRVASGHPDIWIDVCRENRSAILAALDGMIDGLNTMRTIVEEGDDKALLDRLQSARTARANLPGRVRELLDVVEVRVPIPDRAGAAAEVFTLAAKLGVNVANFEVAHSVEGERGILIVVIDKASQDVFRGGLIARGFRPTIQSVS